MAYLDSEIADATRPENSKGYVRAEHAALAWALPILVVEAKTEQVVFPIAEPDTTWNIRRLPPPEHARVQRAMKRWHED